MPCPRHLVDCQCSSVKWRLLSVDGDLPIQSVLAQAPGLIAGRHRLTFWHGACQQGYQPCQSLTQETDLAITDTHAILALYQSIKALDRTIFPK